MRPLQQGEVLPHPADDADLVAVLQVLPTPGRSTRHGMPNRSSSALGPTPESFSSCGVLKAPPARITSRRTSTRTRLRPGRGGGGAAR